MGKSSFYWESLNQKYVFNPRKKYLIYFKCCCCPPHRGHFETIKKLVDMGPNVYAMVHQIGSERRHGVPYNLNRKIWKTFINELLPRDRVFLKKCNNLGEINDVIDRIDGIDTVVYIRGNEDYDINQTERSTRSRFKRIKQQLNYSGIKLDFYFADRPLKNKLCATNFIRNLIKTSGRCKRPGCNCKYKKLKYFFPRDLDETIVMNLVRELQRNNLIV